MNYSRKEVKAKKCRWCNDMFSPRNSLQVCCSPYCAIAYNREKEINKKVKTMAEGLKTHSDYLKMLQVVFNQFIRLRDKDQPCISCGTKNPEIKYDAGHFYSVGAYPNLRLNELNVHKQCSNNCNMHKSGNFAEYNIRLPERIGVENYKKLMEQRNLPLKLTIPEIKDLILDYKNKIKVLQSENK